MAHGLTPNARSTIRFSPTGSHVIYPTSGVATASACAASFPERIFAPSDRWSSESY